MLFQQFYYPIDNPPAGKTWWQQATDELPQLKRLGAYAIWHPVPTKGGSGISSMGYDPYDLYDLGSKNQKGTLPTRFGTKDQYLAYVAQAHANGLQVYADVVMNHAGGADQTQDVPLMAKRGWDDIPDDSKVPPSLLPSGYNPQTVNARSWTLYRPVGADGKPGAGRFPRDYRHFHPSAIHPDRDGEYHGKMFGEDYCFEAENGYVAQNFLRWGQWFRNQTGVDGYRLDAIKHIEPTFLNTFARTLTAQPTAITGNPFFLVGEFWDTDANKIRDVQSATQNQMSLFDFGLYYGMWDMTEKPGEFDMRQLIARRLVDRDRAISFVSNHDVDRFQPINRQKRVLPYALTMVMSGRPSIFYNDYFRPEDKNLPTTLERLTDVHNRYAEGQEKIRFADADILALERDQNLLGIFNDGGKEGKPQTITVPTGFGKKTTLVTVGQEGTPQRLQTDDNGAITVSVPAGGYVLLVPQGKIGHKSRFSQASLPTTQVWEFADDLDTGVLGEKPRSISVTVASGSSLRLHLSDYTRNSSSMTLTVTTGNKRSVLQKTFALSPKQIDLNIPRSALSEGTCQITITTSGKPTNARLAVTYNAPVKRPQ